jgi:hypothetical protein
LTDARSGLNTTSNVAMDVSKKIPKRVRLTHINSRTSAAALRVVRAEDMALEP